MIAVLAGNWAQYVNWCDENRMHPTQDARYIERWEAVQGLRFEEFTKVGTWREASNEAKEAFEHMKLMKTYYDLPTTTTVWS